MAHNTEQSGQPLSTTYLLLYRGQNGDVSHPIIAADDTTASVEAERHHVGQRMVLWKEDKLIAVWPDGGR